MLSSSGQEWDAEVEREDKEMDKGMDEERERKIRGTRRRKQWDRDER